MGIGRFTGGIRRQRAAAFNHDAEAAKTERLDLYRGVIDDLCDLLDRQYPRQYRAGDAKSLVHEIDGFIIGR